MTRNTAFFMHQQAVRIVQQQRAAGSPSAPFSFTDPSFNDGIVLAIIDDGSGGKFVGGTFTSVTCNVTSTTYTTGYTRLVHLLPTGEVDSFWSCPVGSSTVYALALDVANNRLFVGGAFSSIGGELRNDLAMVEASSGTVDINWTCSTTSGDVKALALDVANNRLFVGGSFSNIGGETRADLAMVEASSGDVDILWTCDTNGNVWELALDVANNRLFVGGIFTTIGGQSRTHLAMVEASSGTVNTLWVCSATSGAIYALELDVSNDRLFVGGIFTNIGGQSRSSLALVEASSGTVDTLWTCNVTSPGQVYALALIGANDRLFVGGSFTSIGGESRDDLALVEASSGTTNASWVCNSNSQVWALLSDAGNDALFVGGTFNGATGLDGQQRDRFGTVVASTGDLFVP